MYKRILLFAIVLSIAYTQQNLSFEEAFQRRLIIDSGLQALSQQRTAMTLNKQLSHSLTPTEFESVLEDFGQDEIEISASQSFEPRSIRRNRASLADAELGLIANQAQSYRDEIHYQLSSYFLESVHWHRRSTLAQERLGLMEQTLEWQNHQFNEGALSESELIRSRLEIARLEAELSQINTSIGHFTTELSTYLDTTISRPMLPTILPDLPSKDVILTAWAKHDSAPIVREKRGQIKILKAMKVASETPLISSFALSAGVKLLPEIDQQFSIVGISIESPLFSRRKLETKLRDHELQAGMHELDNLYAQLGIAQGRWMAEWAITEQRLSNLRSTLIPEALELYERIETEYRSGARPYLEVLDAQSLLTDLQEDAMTFEMEQYSLLFELSLTLGVTIYEFN